MDKYIIVTLLKGPAKKKQEGLLREISELFGVVEGFRHNPPAHITLKYPFETNDITYVLDFLHEFTMGMKSFTYEIEGFDHFDKDVIFMDVPDQYGPLREVYDELISEFRGMKKFSMGDFDGVSHFHATVARDDISEKFDSIWEFVSEKEYSIEQIFDNISILKLVNDKWVLFKEVKLKK